jgi:hypothetical protein
METALIIVLPVALMLLNRLHKVITQNNLFLMWFNKKNNKYSSLWSHFIVMFIKISLTPWDKEEHKLPGE